MTFPLLTEPIHPMVVHFPVALIVTAFLFDLLGLFWERRDFSQVAFYLLAVGTVGAVGAFLTGEYLAHEEAEAIVGIHDVLHTHEEAGELAMWFLIVYALGRSWFFFQKAWGTTHRRVFFLASLIGMALILRTGYYGGKLVFEYGAGLKPEALERERRAAE